MIITRLTGGLGNQMFQYAAGLALAEQHRTVLKLDVSWFKDDPAYEAHNRYALSCLNVTEQFATQAEIEALSSKPFTKIEIFSARLAKMFHFYRYAEQFKKYGNLFYDQNYKYDSEFTSQPDFTYLHGDWQSEKYFSGVSELLKLHFSFRYPAPPPVLEMEKKISKSSESAFIHFRRGDYLANPKFKQDLGILTLDYYHCAVVELLKRFPNIHFYIFSDDIDAIEREFQPEAPHTFVRATKPWHSYDKVRLMSKCRHGIIANSTFSWWSAWLMQNPQKIIIAPRMWRKSDSYDCSDAIPKSWLRL
ncbi:MAG: alpha-1,2-fucosyltransferase [Verrucomicrobiota bacterium]